MLLLKDTPTSQEHRKNSYYNNVNTERIDRQHLCEYGQLFPRGPSFCSPPFSMGPLPAGTPWFLDVILLMAIRQRKCRYVIVFRWKYR